MNNIKLAVCNKVDSVISSVIDNDTDAEIYSFIGRAISIRSDINLPVYLEIIKEIFK